MAWLPRSLIGAFTAVGLAATPAAFGNDNNAHAQSTELLAAAPPTEEVLEAVTCPAEIIVPCSDARGVSLDEVLTSAADLSVDAEQDPPLQKVVLVHFGGGDNDEESRQAGMEVIDHYNSVVPGPGGQEIFGMLLADGNAEYRNAMVLYVGGLPVGTLNNVTPSGGLRSGIFSFIQNGVTVRLPLPNVDQ